MRFLLLIGLTFTVFSGFTQEFSASTLNVLDIEQHSNEIAFVAKVTEKFDRKVLEKAGVKVGAQVGDIVTLRSAAQNKIILTNYTEITYLQVANKVQPNLSKVVPDLRADSVYAGHNLNSGYSGKDVIIGVTDWGFDYTHPMFYDTAMENTRILAAWDQFKRSGPHPEEYGYGTVYEGKAELLAAEKDTINIYGYATHGTHVAGIAGGGGAGTEHRGVAYDAEFLFVTFLVDEAAVIDAFKWMKDKAESFGKRLVINMSWGLYNLGPLDGTSLVSQAIDNLSNEGVVFVTSGGNNGGETFHIKKEFDEDTMQTRVHFYRGSVANLWGQSISVWGEESESFGVSFKVFDKSKNQLLESPWYETNDTRYVDSFLVTGTDTLFYNVAIDAPYPLNNKPHIRLRIRNDNTDLRVGLKAYAKSGVVHFYNVTELTTDVGNWGMPFSAYFPGWESGNDEYSLGEPASTRSVITVAAHQSETFSPSGLMGGGFIAPFSSKGPTIDERIKPDVSAPGVSVASSVSSFTNRSYTVLQNVNFNSKSYPFARFSGTSMSSPATAGVVALMLEANPNLYASTVKEILNNTAREDIRTGNLPETGDKRWGWGKVTATSAVQVAEQKFVSVEQLKKSAPVLFPNPTNGLLSLTTQKVHTAEVHRLDGRVVKKGMLGGEAKLNLGLLAQGMYIIQFKGGIYSPMRVVVK